MQIGRHGAKGMAGGFDGLQLDSGSHALRRSAGRPFGFGPVFFILAPSSGKLVGALWPKPQRLCSTMGTDAAFDRPSPSATAPEVPPGRTARSAPFAPTLSASGWLPSTSPPTTQKIRAKKLVALGVPPGVRDVEFFPGGETPAEHRASVVGAESPQCESLG